MIIMAVERLAYTIKEVAEQVGVSQSTIRRAIARGHLPIRKIGHLVRISRQDRDDWLRETILVGMSVGRKEIVVEK